MLVFAHRLGGLALLISAVLVPRNITIGPGAGPKVGDPAPAINALNPDGNTVYDSYRRKFVLLAPGARVAAVHITTAELRATIEKALRGAP